MYPIKFDLLTIDWTAVSAIITFLSILGAYIYPWYKDRWVVRIGGLASKSDPENTELTLFINNRTNRDIEIRSWEIEYEADPENEIQLISYDNEDGISFTVKRNRSFKIQEIIPTNRIHQMKHIAFNEVSGKKFFVRKQILKKIISEK